jgi:alpha-tubulin suppressor-like RCC1 family protein
MSTGRVRAALATLACLSAAACRAPTEWRLVVRSDVPCAAQPRVLVWTAADPSGLDPTTPRAFADTCEGGADDVVVVPKDAQGGFVVRLATRVDGGDPSLCDTAAAPSGCVVQEWRLTFRAHTPQTFQTFLSKSCADVRCASGYTCVRPGVCVSNELPPSCENGCDPEDAGLATAPPLDAADAPAPVALDVYAAGETTCVRDSAARLTCWGAGAQGVLGNGSTANAGDTTSSRPEALTPIAFGPGRTVAKAALAADHACAILDDATLRCWGKGAGGQLGYGDQSSRGDTLATVPSKLLPIGLGAGRSARDVAVGVGTTCVILDDGSLKCWGSNLGGQLGYGDGAQRGGNAATTPDKIQTVSLGAGRTAKRVSVGASHVCVVRDDDALVCWGQNGVGQLGYGDTAARADTPATTPDRLTPVSLGAGRVALQPQCGDQTTCLTTTTSAAFCWGLGSFGELGTGDSLNRGDTSATLPSTIPSFDFGGPALQGLWAGAGHVCAALADKSLRCWGNDDSGQLGYGDTVARGADAATTPSKLPAVSLPAGLAVRTMALGNVHSCAIFDDGSLRCWGQNAAGELGYGDTAPRGDTSATRPGSLPAIRLPR